MRSRAFLLGVLLLGAGCDQLWGPFAGDNPDYQDKDGGGQTAADMTTGTASEWTLVDSGVTANLKGVSGISDARVWAVGSGKTVILWDGSAFRPLDASGVDATDGLTAVAGVPEGDTAWTTTDQGFIYSIEGETLKPSPTLAGLVPINAIWSGNKRVAFAVNNEGVALGLTALNGWQSLLTPITAPLSDVWGTGPSDVSAVSAKGGVVLRYDGSTWSTRFTLDGTPALYGVWAPATTQIGGGEGWAVGSAGVIVHWQSGITADRVRSPTKANLNDIWGSGPSDIWAVGDGGVIVHWDGTAWTQAPLVTDRNLRGVWGSRANDVWVVGDKGLVLRYFKKG